MCNVVPVIGKSDSLLPEERIDFKKRIKAELEAKVREAAAEAIRERARAE